MMAQDPPYLVDSIIPSRRIHLFAGISNSGKSRFLLGGLTMWADGLPLLGKTSHPVPWCVVCSDRPLADAQDTIRSLGLTPSDINIIPAFGKHNKSFVNIMKEIEQARVQFVLWEGLDLMVRLPNHPFEVTEFLSNLAGYCEDGLTVLGTVGIPKLKPSETYESPRQLIGGSTVWERCTATDFVLVPVNLRNIADPRRLLFVTLKNASSFTLAGRFDENGWLTFEDIGSPHTATLLESYEEERWGRRRNRNGS